MNAACCLTPIKSRPKLLEYVAADMAELEVIEQRFEGFPEFIDLVYREYWRLDQAVAAFPAWKLAHDREARRIERQRRRDLTANFAN